VEGIMMWSFVIFGLVFGVVMTKEVISFAVERGPVTYLFQIRPFVNLVRIEEKDGFLRRSEWTKTRARKGI
jgi:hypothetical protein